MDLKKKPRLQPEWIVAALITVTICALHFCYWLNMGGLWRDEVNLVVLSHRHSFADMARDSFPVLMPLIVRVWFAVGLGGSDLHLRLIGLMVGLGTVAALWVGVWKIRREPPLIGLVLLGLNSTMIFFGDSLRAYGLGSVAAVMLTASALVFVQKPSALRAIWLALFATLSVQVLYHNAVLVAAVCFGAWAVCWRRADGRAAFQVLFAAIVSASSLLPYLHILFGLNSNAPTTLLFRTGATMRRFILSCESTLGYPLSGYIYVWGALALAIIACACAGLWRQFTARGPEFRPRPEEDLSLFAAVTLVVSSVGFGVFFWCAQMPMQSWYLLPLLASVAVCFDAGRPAFSGSLRFVFVGLVAVTAVFSGLNTSRLLALHFSDVNLFAKALAEDAAPKDYILVYPWNWAITFNYYYKGVTPWNTVPPLSDHSVHRVDLVLAQMENTNALAPVLGEISQTLKSGQSVWFLGPANTRIPLPGTPPPAPLPLPPLRYFGWSENPYSAVWCSQTLQFIADHSVTFRPFKYSPLNGYLIENANIYIADGWRTNSPGR